MKRLLITGKDSYIGTSFQQYLNECVEEYHIETLDMQNNEWADMHFSGYDSVFHVAGIAHVKETKDNMSLYYKINCDLAIETAKKAKRDGVKQFIYLSSMSVYGIDVGIITKQTPTKPKSAYGKSKLYAEEGLMKLSDGNFSIVIIRPPMVYGKGCKGNFQSLVKIVNKFSFFPNCNNQRSMIHINNLCSFVKLIIDKECRGTYLPQNREFAQTSHIAQLMALKMGKKIYMSKLAGAIICVLRWFIPIVKKSFGSLIYHNSDDWDYSYCTIGLEESINISV